MKIETMPKELACELISFIAEKEKFKTVCAELGTDFTPEQIKALLREVAAGLQVEVAQEKGSEYNVKKCKHLSKNSKKIISYLSPGEEKVLLRAFGLRDGK